MSKLGRPRAELTHEEVKQAVEAGLDFKQIATKYGVSRDTVERRANPDRADKRSGAKKNKDSKPPVDIAAFKAAAPLATPVGSNPPADVSEQASTSVNGRKWLLSKVVGNDVSQRYWYNKDDDRYITVIRGIGEPIVTSGAEHRAICEAYSNFTGNASTLNQMAMNFSMPRPWLIQYLHIHGITHDKEPFSAEELMERETADLADDLYNMKRRAVNTELNERVWKETKVAAEKWNAFEHTVIKRVDDWAQRFAPAYRPALFNIAAPVKSAYSLLVLPMDFHFGMGAWRDEAGQTYSRRQCGEYLKYHTEQILNRAILLGRPTEIIVPSGSDWFHVDNPQGMTTRGTPQDMDGTPEMILTEGMELKIEFIDQLRHVAPVTILPCYGNHDQHTALALQQYLHAWYRRDDDVTILRSHRSRNYYVSGQTLIGATHGNDVKVSDLPTLMASERREEWGRTRHRIYVTGHLHYEQLKDVGGIVQYQCPSLTSEDRWSDGKGFVLSRAALAAVVVDDANGPCEYITSARLDAETVGFNLKNRSRAA